MATTQKRANARPGPETADARADDELAAQVEAVVAASRVLVGIITHSMRHVDGVLSLLQFRTLVIIATAGTMNLGEVAERLDVHPSNATRVVDKLVTARLVDRRDDPADRRFIALTATARGRQQVDQVMDDRRAAVAQIVATMPASRRRALASGLEAFAAASGDGLHPVENLVPGSPT